MENLHEQGLLHWGFSLAAQKLTFPNGYLVNRKLTFGWLHQYVALDAGTGIWGAGSVIQFPESDRFPYGIAVEDPD